MGAVERAHRPCIPKQYHGFFPKVHVAREFISLLLCTTALHLRILADDAGFRAGVQARDVLQRTGCLALVTVGLRASPFLIFMPALRQRANPQGPQTAEHPRDAAEPVACAGGCEMLRKDKPWHPSGFPQGVAGNPGQFSQALGRH